MANPISPKQLDFIKGLAAQKLDVEVDAFIKDNDVEGLTASGASQLIDALKALPFKSAAPVQAQATAVAVEDDIIPAGATHLRDGNQYRGKCFGCGHWVAEREGRIAKLNGKWETFHRKGECGAAAKPAKAEARTSAGLDLSVLPLTPTGHGSDEACFAVPDGDTRLKVRVRRVTKAGRWQGWIFVDDGAAYGMQTKYGKQGPGKAYEGGIETQLAAILADPQAGLARYADLTNHCGVCARPLEDALSVAMGIGPVCAEKLGIVATEDERAHAKAGTKPQRW